MRRCSKYNYNQEPVPGVRGRALDIDEAICIDEVRVTIDEVLVWRALRAGKGKAKATVTAPALEGAGTRAEFGALIVGDRGSCAKLILCQPRRSPQGRRRVDRNSYLDSSKWLANKFCLQLGEEQRMLGAGK